MLTAITRAVSPGIVNCELTFVARQPIDLAKAEEQHRAYQALLEKFGARVVSLQPEPALPDSMFVEDPAIVLDELAIVFPLGTEKTAGAAGASVTESGTLVTPLFAVRISTGPGGRSAGIRKLICINPSIKLGDDPAYCAVSVMLVPLLLKVSWQIPQKLFAAVATTPSTGEPVAPNPVAQIVTTVPSLAGVALLLSVPS